MRDICPEGVFSLIGNMDRTEQAAIYRRMSSSSDLRLLYTTPEKIVKSKLLMTNLQKAYEQNRLNSIVIDEAHCASQWGHDFRPDYGKLHVLRTVFPNVPFLLLTATANSTVRTDVIEMLQLDTSVPSIDMSSANIGVKGLKVFVGDFDRSNLQFEVVTKPVTFSACIDRIKTLLPIDGSGNALIYCFSQVSL